MIAKMSPFVLRDFLLLKQIMKFLPPPNNENVNIPEVSNLYKIDIDFNIQEAETPIYQIFVKIEINYSEDKLVGYSIFSEGVGIFQFDKSLENNKPEQANYLYFSGIPICINSLRSIISSVTSHGPLGKYTLPSIDMNELLKDKGILKA